ncbi:MAG: hypothetical protein HYR56_18580 [Acidobacteria bacterium]|nr:hypothetical protein [Acidobacteriota bacterium]MBI3424753.1 hypothetical protein [Acidobacteriota bacterium]
MQSHATHLRRILSCGVLALGLWMSAAAQTPTIPLGSYTAVIAQDMRVGNLTFPGGEYQLTLLEGGKYQLGRNNFITLSGTYTVSGNLVKFASPATMDTCSGEGMYQFTITGNRLTLTAATTRVDSCVERLVGLTGAAFFKDDPANKDWKGIGPTGGQFNAVIIHDGKIYAGGGGSNSFLGSTGGGVFISADNGQTWRATRGIRADTVFDLAGFNNVLYAGCSGGALYFSTDGGENWERPLLGIAVTALVHDFYEYNGRLYVATVGDGVWRLGDSPYKWEKLGTTGLTNQNIWALAGSGNNFYAAGNGGVYLSTDGGATWTLRNNGMTFSVIQALALDGGKIYAGTQQGTAAQNEVWMSEDNALNWKKLGNGIAADFPTGFSNRIYEMAVAGGKLFAVGTTGVIMFDGTKWSTVFQGTNITSFFSIAASGNTLFAGSWYHGIARSTDGGATWAFANNGLNSRQVGGIYRANGVIYAGTTRGVMISCDEGQTWTQTTAPIVECYSILPFDGKVFAGFAGGVAYTADQGQTWTVIPASSGIGGGFVFRLLNIGNALYAGINNATTGGVFRTMDGGQTWTALNNGLTSRNVFDLAATSTALFASTTGAGVFRSTDGGQNWVAVNNGLPSLTIVGLAAVKDTVVAAVIGNTLYRSTDNGQTWRQPEGGAMPTGTGWLIDAAGGNFYASNFSASGALRSTDEGRTWQYVNAGFDARWGIRWFADGGTLYAGTPNGVYVSNGLVNRAATVSAASFTPRIADKSIVAAFGRDLATRDASATSLPLPTNLGGTTVKVRDSNGVERLAPLFAVAAEQVNYQVPAGTAAGTASVIITNANGISATGEFNIAATAPALFALTANGAGPAAAIDALTGAAAPFNATQANGQPNILAVFGTGLGADATDLDGNVNAGVTATIGGRAATVLYAGRGPGITGVNQFNLTLPAGLAAGTHTLVITRGGVASNSVTLAIR